MKLKLAKSSLYNMRYLGSVDLASHLHGSYVMQRVMHYATDAQHDQIAGYLNTNALRCFRNRLMNISCNTRNRTQQLPLHIVHFAATVGAFGDAAEAEFFETRDGKNSAASKPTAGKSDDRRSGRKRCDAGVIFA